MSEEVQYKERQRDEFREFYLTRDPDLRDRLIESHLSLAGHLARRFANRGESYDDLMQVASLALVNALERFDPATGFEFSTFATSTIIGELKRHFRDKGWSVRAPRRIQELYLEVSEAVARLSQELGRSPSVRELAESCSAAENDVIEALAAGSAYRPASLDAPGPDGETMSSRLGGDDEVLLGVERRAALSPHLERLPEREQIILQLRFVEGLTQSEIARRVGLSQMHVSRLLSGALAALRESYGSNAI
jgi:RNA polymerase sigma-B factor